MSGFALPAAVQRMVDAINAADTEAFVAAFTPEGFVSDWGTVKTGPEGVRAWAASDAIGAGARMTVLTAETEGDTTRIRFDWRSSVFTGESDGIFVVSGDRLASFTIPPSH
ncbi:MULTISPECIES: nuclear transport factor 2 family protein [unclassified Microbacterium]|uniref:nuclear transport factor 2 family protein n=1 Tax=unclassified Microbacterium TaxID=2609290 RepID=UPI001AC86AEB|nr:MULTISPECIES: nuclear transport factor 2 family protein [unclassified Microbacterium]MBN9156166.1 nuclear transport factor 2 family protein [Microbacterium sp.]MBS1896052.1 nuclear transport factor 2 family protein [Actinomycetota bacterium]MBS1900936.1 nuclear transport factor 2 family protein [Actinomycetota bacterium]